MEGRGVQVVRTENRLPSIKRRSPTATRLLTLPLLNQDQVLTCWRVSHSYVQTQCSDTCQRRTVVWQAHRLTVGGEVSMSCSAVQTVMFLSRGLVAIAEVPAYSHATQYCSVDGEKVH